MTSAGRRTRPLFRVLAVAFFGLSAACHNASAPVVGSRLIPQFTRGTIKAPNALDVVEVYTAEAFKAEGEVILRSAEPLMLPSGLELLETRVSFLASRDKLSVNGYPGTFCTDRWPPAGLGPSYDIAGLAIHDGDTFAVTFFVRAKSKGDWIAEGISIAYDSGGKRSVHTTRATKIEVTRRDRVDQLPEPPTCNPKQILDWIEPYPYRGKSFVVVTSPTPTRGG